jgi:hypothetical protein
MDQPIEVLDADWVPEDDTDVIRQHEELRRALRLACGYPETPLTALQYRAKVSRLRRRRRRVDAVVGRVVIGSLLFFVSACVLALLVG